MMAEKLPWKSVFKWILLSTLVTSSLTIAGLIYWNHHQEELSSNDRYNLVAICQSCNHKEPLQTDFLAELLGLSSDKPTNLYRFDIKSAKQKLLDYPIIKSAEVRKVKPGMLFIEYSLRQPIAYLAEYSNTAIDVDGVLIPSKPFYTPKNHYELVLGLPKGLVWGMKISGKSMTLIQTLLKSLSQEISNDGIHLSRIDVSKAFSQRYGEREIVLFFEESIDSDIDNKSFKNLQLALRLSPDNWQEQLINYKELRQKLRDESLQVTQDKTLRYIVDMRLSQLAFIQKL